MLLHIFSFFSPSSSNSQTSTSWSMYFPFLHFIYDANHFHMLKMWESKMKNTMHFPHPFIFFYLSSNIRLYRISAVYNVRHGVHIVYIHVSVIWLLYTEYCIVHTLVDKNIDYHIIIINFYSTLFYKIIFIFP